ncbi:hypothetical protein LUZ60_005516 [Juncus effusus]|nr:hypothetical protein LUZ60_005516 [Juncus effusus]
MRGMDRISLLHDCLIHRILSFLETKESVRTTVLSKQWIHIWKSVPRLDLHSSDFPQKKVFENFVKAVLLSRSEQLNSFSLTINWHNKSLHMLSEWISHAFSLKPTVVSIARKQPCVSVIKHLDPCSLTCSTTSSLSLHALKPSVVNLAHLKSLNLKWISLEDEFLKTIMLGCPVLQELFLQECFFEQLHERIRSSTLKKLTIKNCAIHGNNRVRISIPSLVCLSCDFRLGDVSFENLESLERADVTLWFVKGGEYCNAKMVMLLNSLSNAKHLRFTGYGVQDMLEKEATLRLFPIFRKLKSLELGSFRILVDCFPIYLFLKGAPNLEKLILKDIYPQSLNDIKVKH